MLKRKINLNKASTISILLAFYDVITICLSYLIGLLIRFDFDVNKITNHYLEAYEYIIIPYVIVCIVIYIILRLYRSVWRFASYNELVRIIVAVSLCAFLNITVINFIVFRIIPTALVTLRMPISFYIMGYLFQLIFATAVRFSYRFILLLKNNSKVKKHNVMLIGAGNAGLTILRDINKNPDSDGKVVCIIDDNDNKLGRYIDGVPIVGNRNDILLNVDKYKVDQIYFAIPSANNIDKRDILNICKETGLEIKVLPGIQQLINGNVSVNMLKSVAIEDLLGRDVIKVNNDEIFNYLTNKVILVTGGGGSIGSELCRQVASHNPKQLIIFDIYENNAYDIENELRRKYKNLDLKVLIGSVRDSKRLDNVFGKYRPEIVFHAAAHKHVPLMENSPCEAIKNNTIGTFKTAYTAVKYGVKRFVLISTDKAVNPTNIMGASKRMCEMVIQTFDKLIKNNTFNKLNKVEDLFSQNCSDIKVFNTEFVAVRFGNVLGSNGSVIPLFKKQIELGGPVTVTHKDIVRYFMTIPEAVSLILQALVYAKGGEIFVLDMGEPVKIDTLARNLIKLSGLKPDEDIKIEYTGLRPGEKLYEEKLMDAEGNTKTDNDLIYVGKPLDINEDKFIDDLRKLYDVSNNNDEEEIFKLVEEVVDTYKRDKR